jgi:hypothetical protein
MMPTVRICIRTYTFGTHGPRDGQRTLDLMRWGAGARDTVAFALGSCAKPKAPSTGGTDMETLFEVRNIAVSIHRSPRDVYAFISNGENVPQWAKGLGTSIRRVDDEWVAQGPIGNVRVRFSPPNDLGIADHDVILETGVTVHNPVRVVPNGTGSTVIFTLMRLPDVSDQEFNQDAAAVERDLSNLKVLLEGPT